MNNTPTTSGRHVTSNRSRLARLALPVTAAALVLSACNLEVDFDEASVRQSFDVADFTAIEIDAPFEVTVRQGESQRLDIEVGESLVDDLSVEVVDGELRIDLDAPSFNISRDLVATITVTDLASLHASSASDVVVVDIDVDDLDVRTDTASQISISGSIDTLDLDMSEASQADFDGATITTVELEMSGASQADFSESVDTVTGSIRGASQLDVDNATNTQVSTSGASSVDRN